MLEKIFVKHFRYALQERMGETHLDYIYPRPYTRSKPDLVILGPNHLWAALEFKESKNANRQPNQEYYIERLNENGYARFVYPENAEEVLDELEELFTS
jgi:hypothetical protein